MEEYNLNPYHNHNDSLETITVTPVMIEHLRSTRPWVLFLSILMFISVGFMFLAGFMMLIASSAPVGMRGAAAGPIIAIIYWLIGGLYLVPAIYLFKYASSIKDLIRGGGDSAMETALESQKSFWRFTGIVTLVVVCLYVLVFLFGIFALMRFSKF